MALCLVEYFLYDTSDTLEKLSSEIHRATETLWAFLQALQWLCPLSFPGNVKPTLFPRFTQVARAASSPLCELLHTKEASPVGLCLLYVISLCAAIKIEKYPNSPQVTFATNPNYQPH